MKSEPLKKNTDAFSNIDAEFAEDIITHIQRAIAEPLSTMFSSVDLLCSLMDNDPSSIQEQCLSEVNAACYRMQHLSQELSLLAKIKCGILTANRKNEDLIGLIADYINETEPHLNFLGHALEWNCAIGHCLVSFDRDLISHLFMALISYCVGISPKNGVIRVSVDGDDDFLTLAVVCDQRLDTNALDELRNRIANYDFDTRSQHSLDTGLIVSSGIAAAHDATMKIDSDNGKTMISVRFKREIGIDRLRSNPIVYSGSKISQVLLGLADILPDSEFSPLKNK